MSKQQLIEKLSQFAQNFEEFSDPQFIGIVILFVVIFLFMPFCFLVIFFRLRKIVAELKQTLDQVSSVSNNIEVVSKNIEYMGISLIEFLTTYREAVEHTSQRLEEYNPEEQQENAEGSSRVLSDRKVLQTLFKIFKKQ